MNQQKKRLVFLSSVFPEYFMIVLPVGSELLYRMLPAPFFAWCVRRR